MSYNAIEEEDSWVPLHLREKLSVLHILGIAASNIAPSVLWMITPTFFEPLSSKLKVSKIWQTVILFGGSLSGFVVCPLAGVYSDSCTFKYGRRRIYMIVSMFLIILGLLMMCYCCEIGEFLNPDNPNPVQQFVFGFSYEFVCTAGNILQTPCRSLCSDVTPIHQQNLMANICSFFGGLGGIIVNIFGGLRFYEHTSLQQDQFMLVVSAIFCTIPILISVIVTREERLTTKPPCINPFKDTFDAIKGLPKPVSRTLLSMLFAQIAYFQFAFQFNHFMGKDIFKGDNSDPTKKDLVKRYDDGVAFSMFCGAMRYGSQSVFGIFNAQLIDKFGYKWNTFIGYLCLTIGEVFFFFVNNKYAYLFIPILHGIGYGVAITVPYAIASICATIYKQNIGAFFGILIMVTVIGEQCSNLGIGSGLAQIWGDNPRLNIAVSCVFGVIATGFSFLVVEPTYSKEQLTTLTTSSTDNSFVLTEA